MSNLGKWIAWSAVAAIVMACGGSTVEDSNQNGTGGSGGATGGSGGATGGSGGATGGSGGAEGGSGGATGGSGGETGGSGGGYLAGCPDSPPAANTSCPKDGLTCSYGDHFIPQCRLLFRCQKGNWIRTSNPDAPICKDEPSPECPATPPANESQCSKDKADKLQCTYEKDNTVCRCSSTDCSAGPCRQIDPPAWICKGGPSDPKCPKDMPNAGTACSTDGQRCEYLGGGCAGGASMVCKDGVWILDNPPCPV